MNGIIRVFSKRNQYTPIDNYAFYGLPPLDIFIPEHKEVHISCTFTWDKPECEFLAYNWEGRTNKSVKLGGVAYAVVPAQAYPILKAIAEMEELL